MGTAGSVKYHTLTPMYYRGASAAIVVYDVTSFDSFERAEEWVRELQDCGPEGLIIALVGNKSDLAGEAGDGASHREVPCEAARRHAEELGCHAFSETSALTGAGVTELFRTVARRVAEGALAHVKVEGLAQPETVRNCCAPWKQHTEYTLRLQTTGGGGCRTTGGKSVESRCIRTRYKSVAALHRKLSKTAQGQGLPALPPKVFGPRRRLAGATVEAREQSFTHFLRHALVRCKDSPLLQEFLERSSEDTTV